MKYLIIFLSALFVISCGGESLEEKNKKIELENNRVENIKLSTCAVLKETTEEQNAFRVKELNSARASIGQEPFIDGDKVIQNAIKFGLCESLVGNDADFNQHYELSLRKEQEKKDELISLTCNRLNLSYTPKEITSENKDNSFYNKIFLGTDFDDKYVESININKMLIVNEFRANQNLPPFDGELSDINKLQFLGACKELLIGDLDKIAEKFSLYEKINKIANANKKEHSPIYTSYLTKDGSILFFIPTKPYKFIDLDTLEEKAELSFDGTLQRLYENPMSLGTFPAKFEFKNNKFFGDYYIYYANKKLRVLTSFDENGRGKKREYWYINGQKKMKSNRNNGKLHGDYFEYAYDGSIESKTTYVNGSREGTAFWYGNNYCYKNDKKVDLEECK